MRVTIVLPRVDLPAGRSRFVAGSLAAHVALALGIVWVPTWWRGPTLPSDAMTVELVGALPEPAPPAPAAPAESTQAEPEPEPPKEEVQLATPPPVKPKATPTPKPKATPKPASPKPKPTAPPQATPASTGGEGAAGSADRPPTAGSAAAGGSVSALAGLDSAFGWYRAAVTQALYGRWQRPIVEGLTGPVEVKVAFEIGRNGQVSGLRLEQASGVPTLDRSALRAVSDASPLPPLPSGLDGPLPASFVFRLYPDGG